MLGLQLLLLCEVYAVEGVVLESHFPLSPPPFQLLPGVFDEIVVMLRRFEDVVVVEGAKGTFVR